MITIIVITDVAPFTYDPFTYHPFYLPVVGKRVAHHHDHYRHVFFYFFKMHFQCTKRKYTFMFYFPLSLEEAAQEDTLSYKGSDG